jgi:exodeoxyribonuclease III
MGIRIISYNLNGLRSAISKGFLDWLAKENPDILFIQETKIQEDQLDKMAFELMGYHQFWSLALKKGYSGIGILSKIKPDFNLTGIGIKKFDDEGRLIRVDFGDLTLINTYIPSGTTGDERQAFKMEYLNAIFQYLKDLKISRKNIILSGDYNIAHKPIDINHPERHKKTSGFLPEERAWMDLFLASGFIDTFRVFNSQPEQYSWWSYRANSRGKNLGWRIDYHMATESLKPKLLNAGIMKDVVHSDHCPVWVELDWYYQHHGEKNQ